MSTLSVLLEVTKHENPTWNLDTKKFNNIMKEYEVLDFSNNGKKYRKENPEISSVYRVYENLSKRMNNMKEETKEKKVLKKKIEIAYFDYRWLKLLKERLEYCMLSPNAHRYCR